MVGDWREVMSLLHHGMYYYSDKLIMTYYLLLLTTTSSVFVSCFSGLTGSGGCETGLDTSVVIEWQHKILYR